MRAERIAVSYRILHRLGFSRSVIPAKAIFTARHSKRFARRAFSRYLVYHLIGLRENPTYRFSIYSHTAFYPSDVAKNSTNDTDRSQAFSSLRAFPYRHREFSFFFSSCG